MKNRMTKDEFKLWISEDTWYYGTYLDEEGNWEKEYETYLRMISDLDNDLKEEKRLGEIYG